MSGKTASPSALDAFECKSSFEFFITSYNHNARANLFTTPGANVYAVSPYIYIYTYYFTKVTCYIVGTNQKVHGLKKTLQFSHPAWAARQPTNPAIIESFCAVQNAWN